MSIVQGPFSVAPCQTLISRFATFPLIAVPHAHAAAAEAAGPELRARVEAARAHVVVVVAATLLLLLLHVNVRFCRYRFPATDLNSKATWFGIQ
jgi:hypothetical protein